MTCGQCSHGFCWDCLFSHCRCGEQQGSDSDFARGPRGAANFVSHFTRYDPLPASNAVADPTIVGDIEGSLALLNVGDEAASPEAIGSSSGCPQTAQCQEDGAMRVRRVMEVFLQFFNQVESETVDWDIFLAFCKQYYVLQDAQGTLSNLHETKKANVVLWDSLLTDGTSAEAHFLELAHEKLFQSRRVLKYSHVFEYFSLTLRNEKDLLGAESESDDNRRIKRQRCHMFFTLERFQHMRTRLEELTEQLAESLDKFATNQEIDRFDVVNKAAALGRLTQNFLCCAEDGLGDA
jgi:Ariadne domain